MIVVHRSYKVDREHSDTRILCEVKFWCGKPSRLHDRVYLEEEGGKAKVEERVLGTLIVKWENRKDQSRGCMANSNLQVIIHDLDSWVLA
ncbi:uncharacterized protein C8R40DRAFT_1079240 [Lentinula edodes]|uniref:uncharacterized protein n=1 Tax=Lentinula edodes TaxID=5353 RepID=UPI001E8DCD3B|nr:uncharacterized protein C8R40DRAFT_1079240 [Lentinula edodes]KAH7881647.1 hypothetical protein C8R40DRAFT_1079240 [Lentinula edodes]